MKFLRYIVFIPIVFNLISRNEWFFVSPDIPPDVREHTCSVGIPCVDADIDPYFEFTAEDGYSVEMVIMYLDWYGQDTAILFPFGGCLRDTGGNDLYCVEYRPERVGFAAWRVDYVPPYHTIYVEEVTK